MAVKWLPPAQGFLGNRLYLALKGRPGWALDDVVVGWFGSSLPSPGSTVFVLPLPQSHPLRDFLSTSTP